MTYDEQYLEALKRVLIDGTESTDRTGVGTKKVFDVNFNVDLTPIKQNHGNEFMFYDNKYILPALTLRKVFPRTAFFELIWMLRGSTDVTELQDRGITIWNGNSSREFLDAQGLTHIKEGHIGRGYGRQFRNFNGVDQLKNTIKGIKENPNGRRHVISLWNPSDLPDTALAPCHLLYNFMVEGDKLHLKFIQRSCDLVLGATNNIMFSAFFLTLMAKWTGLTPGRLAHSITDCHIYDNHKQVAHELLFNRDPINHVATYNFEVGMSDRIDHIDRDLYFLFKQGNLDWMGIDYQHNDPIPPKMLKMAV